MASIKAVNVEDRGGTGANHTVVVTYAIQGLMVGDKGTANLRIVE